MAVSLFRFSSRSHGRLRAERTSGPQCGRGCNDLLLADDFKKRCIGHVDVIKHINRQSRRFFSSHLHLVCLALIVVLSASAPAAPPPAGVAPVLTPMEGFGIDGDLLARQPTIRSGDWVTATNLAGSGEGVFAPDGTSLNPLTSFHFIDPFGDRSQDLIFTGGSKWADNPNTWRWTTGKPSSKADINNLLFHVASDDVGHTWLVMSADRASTQGESYIDFELLQNPLVRTNNGAFVSSGPHGGRTTNDLVLSLGFAGGGKVADFLVWRWEADGNGGYHYADITPALPEGRVFVALNTNSVPVSYSAFGVAEYPPNAFAEAAIDLTAMIDGVEPCESFGFVAIMAKTKSSTSASAGIEDFLDPIAYDFRIGPLADAGSNQVLCAEAAQTEFILSGSVSAGLAPVISTHWSVVSGSATLTDSNSPTTTALVSSPTATLRLEVVQSNGCTDSDEVVLTTLPPPAVAIAGPAVLCPGVTAEFSAPPGMDNYQWLLSGNASILDSTNEETVVVLTGQACGEPFEVTLTVSSNICTVTRAVEILVEDDTPPTLLTGADRMVECGLAWDFDPVSAYDNCVGTNALVEIVGTVTNLLVGDTFSATRTWLAIDSCGNTSLASQTVTIVDTTPPQIICSTDVVVECIGPSGTEAFFVVTASDVCDSNVEVVCTPVSGATFPFGVTEVICVATDDSGNTNQCSFLVTVQDTTPPEITCPADITQDTDAGLCEAVVDPGMATATDACAGVTVVGVRSDTLLLSEPYPKGVTLITWTATDAVGLTNICAQTITVIDNEPPVITCSSDLLFAELPQDSGSALVEFAVPLASDNCSPAPEVVCLPPSGSSFPLGETVVQCVATDGAGNTSGCSFTVRVIPYRLTVTEVSDSGPGSLREALIAANTLPGENLIEFNFPGPGPHTIRPETNLPIITSPVVLDGRSPVGFSGSPVIELDGGLSGGEVDGLVFQSGSNTVLSLSIFGFDNAIVLSANHGGSIIQGTYVGVDASGTNAVGSVGDGLQIGSADNRIGGSGLGEANLIAGNGGNGIRLSSESARSNQVLGNFIGVGLNGLAALPNGGTGIFLEAGAANNQIGSLTPAEANRIGANGGAGIALSMSAGTDNQIGINVIDANGELGIDLGNDGVTDNDSNDSDIGPNNLQNFPVLTDARSVDGITTIDGSLTSQPDQSYRLDFYLNDTADPTGYGEGRTYLGYATLFAGESGPAEFSASFAIAAVFTQFVTATATDSSGNTSEFCEAHRVRTPAVAEQVPSSTNVVAGSSVTLCASASGTPPIRYQWRLNGANISGETNQCITLSAIEAQNAGAYSVIIYNDLGGSGTEPANLLVPVTNSVPARDDFEDREAVEGLSGLSKWSNSGATRELDEPLHAGKPGGKSVWYSWVASKKGIVTMGTRGSTFDTLLGVYMGDHVTNLTVVASDEDRGGFFSSGLRFNAIKDSEYAIAIDGYFGDSGDFVFGWTFEDTPHLLPIFLQQPQSLTVRSNGTAEFNAEVSLVCGNGVIQCPDPSDYPNGVVPGLETQWYFEGLAIPGATNASLAISNVQPSNLGEYWMEATTRYYSDGVDRTIRSDVADLQINQTGQDGFEAIQAKDKFLDTLLSPPWRIGGLVPTTPPATNVLAASGLTSGYTGTQIFNTVGSSTSSGETLLCGVPGGSSEWVTLVSESDGLLVVDTDGSDYDTILAIYAYTQTNNIPTLIDCHIGDPTSELSVPVNSGDTNVVLVDGQYGTSGILMLNYSLLSSVSLQALGFNGSGQFIIQVQGYPDMSLSIECSTNMVEWTELSRTTSADALFNYTDTTGPHPSGKYYRVVLLP